MTLNGKSGHLFRRLARGYSSEDFWRRVVTHTRLEAVLTPYRRKQRTAVLAQRTGVGAMMSNKSELWCLHVARRGAAGSWEMQLVTSVIRHRIC